MKQNLRLDHLNDEEKNSITSLCSKFKDIFHLENEVTDPKPIYTKTYPQVHKEEVKKQIDKMIKQDIIRPSTSLWSSPL